MQQVDPDVLSCLDYLMASSDYLEFIGLMLDFKVRFNLTDAIQEANSWQNDE